MKHINIIICLILFFSSGCMFSGSDLKESRLIEPYYITYSGLNYELVIKEKGASTNKVIISSNIDSIGWDDKYIFGKTANQYFILNRNTQYFTGKYQDFFEFTKAKKLLGLKNDVRKTSELL